MKDFEMWSCNNKIPTQLLFLLILTASSTIKSNPINHYDSNYAPAHEYKEQDYSFSYGVKDMLTGDVKTQWEKKEGNTIIGHYSVLEADGSIRTVEYTADETNGFNAVVKHNGKSQHSVIPSSHKEIQTNHIQVHPIKTEYKKHADETGHSYEYKESSPVMSTYTYETRKVPQHENNEISASTKYYHIKPAEHINLHTFKPSLQIAHYKNTLKDSYNFKNSPTIPNLPIDLNLLPGEEEIIPVDISKINPVEINLSETSNPPNFQLNSKHPLHPSPGQELGIYFRDYRKFNEPQLEKGFKPISTTPKTIDTHTRIPNTYKSGKKPVTTPGLRHYATKPRFGLKPLVFEGVHTRLTPLIFAKQLIDLNSNQNALQKAEVIRLHPSGTKNGFVRYATHVRFVEEEK